MSISVDPQPDAVPPRVRIDLDSDDPTKPFTSLTVYRDGVPIREQPYVGATEAVAWDYEAPFGVPAVYTAIGEIATFDTILDVTWSSLSGWSTTSGTPAVGGGKMSGGGVSRPLPFVPQGQIDSQGLADGGGAFSAEIKYGPLRLQRLGGTLSPGDKFTFGSRLRAVDGLEDPFTLVWGPDSATLTTSTGTYNLDRLAGTYNGLVAASASGTGAVKGFTVAGPTTEPFDGSATTTLDVDEAWLIHPTFPSLSKSIDPGQHKFRDDGINVDATSKSSKGRAARATRHEPYGRKRAIIITSGPRAAAEWDLRLRTRTLEHRDAVENLIEDQTPLLLRSPAGWSWDLPDDWYSVGDYTEERPRPRLDSADRLMTLPLTPVDPPVVRQAPVWTYGSDLLLNPTYGDSLAMFPTYFDRLIGTQA